MTKGLAAKRTSLLRLLGGAGLYAGAFLTPRVLRLALIPIVVAVVGLPTYGTYVMLSVIIALAHIMCELGMGTAALRLAPHEASGDRPSLFSSMLLARIAVVTAIVSLLFVSRDGIASLLTGSAEHRNDVTLVLLTIVPFTLVAGLSDQLRSEERHSTVAGLSAARDVFEAALTFLFVIRLRDTELGGLRGLLLSRLLAYAVLLLVLAWHCRATLRAIPRLRYVTVLARLGVPIAALYFLINFREVDRYLIKTVLGVAYVGRYDLALRIVGPVALGNTALAMVLEPYVYRTYTDPRSGAAIGSFLRLYVVLFGGVAFALSMVAPEIFPLLAPGSHEGAAVIAPALVFAFVGDGVLRVAGLGAEFAKRTGVWLIVAAVHLVVALPGTWLTLRPFGIFGAGVALLAGTLVSAQVAYALSRQLFPLDLPIRRATAVVVVGFLFATLLVGGAGRVAPLPARLLSVLVFLAVAQLMAGVPWSEVRALTSRRETPDRGDAL